MAISYTQQRTNVPAPVAQLPSLLGRGDQQQQQQSSTAAMVMPPPSDLLLRLWSVIQRLEDEVNVERERNNVLTTQVDNLADRLAASNTLLATLSGIPPPPPTADAPVTAFSSTSFGADSHVPVVAAAHEESSRPSYRSVVTGSGPHLQHLARGVSSSPSSDVSPHQHEAPLVDTNFPDHGVPLWHVLRSLSNVDEKRVFTVRKIQKLGFESPPKLREYFSMWGKVTNILVLHRQARTASTSGGDSNNDKNVRVRPPSVGFVVMEDPDVVSRILSTPKHTICGHSCEVQVFERKHRHSTGSSSNGGGESFSALETSTISSPTSPESSPASGMSNKSDEFELPAFMRELRSGSMAMGNLFAASDKKEEERSSPARAYSTTVFDDANRLMSAASAGAGASDPSPLVVLWRLAYALKGLSREAALDVKLSEAARVVMSSELKTSGPLLLGLSRLHKLKVEVVETMAEGLIGRMLRNPTAANNWSGGGRGAAKSSKKRGRGGAPPLAPSLPAISEEADGWSEAETIDALRENARLLSPAMKAIMEHMTPSRSAPSPFSQGNTPLDDLLSAAVASSSSRRSRRRGSAMSSESPVRSVNLGGGADDSAMDIDTLR
ncbi:acyl-protein thioesterase, partial [Perkinsus olseni]